MKAIIKTAESGLTTMAFFNNTETYAKKYNVGLHETLPDAVGTLTDHLQSL